MVARLAKFPIIALWCHPRSMSTAMERVMRERGDCRCFHEPLTLEEIGIEAATDRARAEREFAAAATARPALQGFLEHHRPFYERLQRIARSQAE